MSSLGQAMRRVSGLVGVLFVLGVMVVPARATEFGAWDHNMRITFPGYTKAETLANVPLLVVLNESITGFHYADCASGTGGDLRFAAADGTTELPYEIESWNTGGDSLVWVRVPSLAGTNTSIWAFWGNAAETAAPAYTTDGTAWSSAYEAVWHFAQTSGALLDSAGKGVSGTVNGSITRGATGMVGSAFQWPASPGVGDNVYFGADTVLGITGTMSIQAWFKTGSGASQAILSRFQNGGSYPGYEFNLGSGGAGKPSYYGNPTDNWTSSDSGTTYHDDAWHQMCTVHGSGNLSYYMDGVASGNPRAYGLLLADSGASGYLGRSSDGNRPFAGSLDEVRVSSNVLSADWVWATWANVTNNATFNRFGVVGTGATWGFTVTDVGGYRIHTFTQSGTYVNTSASQVDVLVVGGGGGGGGGTGGGGGGGGVVYSNALAVTPGNYTIVIGTGGAGGSGELSAGGDGGYSAFGSLVAYGGGGGGNNSTAGRTGGSGGGGGHSAGGGGYTNLQGSAGGAGGPGSGNYTGGGGGGAGGAGVNGAATAAGNGGIGITNDIMIITNTYAGGGGGGTFGGGTAGTGGSGVGGNGGSTGGGAPTSGALNTGSGGGGQRDNDSAAAGSGGSGVVIIRHVQVGDVPAVNNTNGAENITLTGADLVGYLSYTGSTPTTVRVYWGPDDGGMNAGAWANTNTLPANPAIGSLSTPVTVAASNVMHFYRFHAENGDGGTWASASASFLPGAVTVAATTASTSEKPGASPGVFTISRPPAATNGTMVVRYTLGGTAHNGGDYTSVSSNATLAVGVSNVTITIVPVFEMVPEASETVVLTLASGRYVSGPPDNATVTIEDALAFSATAVNTWTGTGDWTNAANWSQLRAPIEGDDVHIGGAVMLTNDTPVLLAVTVDSGSLTFAGYDTLLIASNVTVNTGTVTHLPQTPTTAPWTADQRVYVECVSLSVASGASMNVAGKGHAGDRGPGVGPTRGDNGAGAGGGYGGAGGPGVGMVPPGGATYGVAAAPTEPGSGGGKAGSAGGGVIRITAVGTVRVDGGLDASGDDEPAFATGSGSGGSIWITCGAIAGSGTIAANGGINTEGNHYGGSGGGGRVAVDFARDWFVGGKSVAGGGGAETGTLVWNFASTDPVLYVQGSPQNFSVPSPYAYGTNAVAAATLVSNSVVSPAAVAAGQQAACIGWRAVLANASTHASGADTLASFVMPAEAVTLIYEWTNVWQLAVSSGPNGGVTAGVSDWYTNGTVVAVTATADGGHAFAQWTGDVPAGQHQTAALSLTMDQARTLVAHFADTTPGTKTRTASGAWEDDSAWTPAGMPGPQDDAVIGAAYAVALSDPLWVGSVTNAGTLTFGDWNHALIAGDVYNSGTIDHAACSAVGAPTNRIYLQCHDLTVPVGGAITADAKGYAAQQGPGAGETGGFGVGGGGGYGGAGGQGYTGHIGNDGGPSYGVSNNPTGPGSGGGHVAGGSGGGAIWIEASGAIAVDGAITAHGQDTGDSRGGGSGGAIFLDGVTLTGGGIIAADGGHDPTSNHFGGPGGGGRIALLYENDLFSGTVRVDPGLWLTGWNGTPAATGTIYRLVTAVNPSLTISGSPLNASTASPRAYGSVAVPEAEAIVNAVVTPTDAVGGARWACVGWTVSTSGVQVASGAGAEASFAMPANNAQLTYFWTNEYALAVSAAANGSVNAGASGWYTNGASVELTATADGGYVFSQWTGDATPGGEFISPMTVVMTQARTIQAQFASTSAGTKVWTGTGNWTTAGNWSPVGAPGPLDDVWIAGGNVTLSDPVTVANLVVTNGATLTMADWDTALNADQVVNAGTITHAAGAPGVSNRVAIACASFTLTATGVIDVNGMGYPHQSGPGLGGTDSSYLSGGGGGYGGVGGHGFGAHPGATGGPVYGTADAPIGPGSGGGGALGGAGGGAVRIDAAGTMRIDGTISADGAISGVYNSGGGSGGAIWLTCSLITGNGGSLHANGGNQAVSANKYGGGGGGGRIAVGSVYDDSVNVTMQANGGTDGSADGAPGSVERYSNGQPLQSVIQFR